MCVGIDQIFEYLSWYSSEQTQQRGIELASKINSLSVFILPIEGKSIWKNCAKVLVSKSDEKLKRYSYELFEWLQDMNWPGAELIYDRLMCLSDDVFFPAYEYSLSAAKKMQDHPWEQALIYLFNERQKQKTVGEANPEDSATS